VWVKTPLDIIRSAYITLVCLSSSTSEHGEVGKIRLSYIPLMFGTGLVGCFPTNVGLKTHCFVQMSISLPNFTAYSELVYGSIPLLKREYRAMIALGCFSPALGSKPS